MDDLVALNRLCRGSQVSIERDGASLTSSPSAMMPWIASLVLTRIARLSAQLR